MSQLLFNEDGSIELPDSIKRDIEKSNIKNRKRQDKLDIWEEPEFNDQKYNLNDDVSGFNLYKNNQLLEPLEFSNMKSQKDIVNEVINAIKSGKKTIFIRGVCGTGKSVIALNIAKILGSASIIVPGKALQKQYWKDYSHDCYILKDNHTKLKIKIITGRENHRCLFCKDCNVANPELPCKIEIKEANVEKLKEYLKENPKVDDNLELKNIRRISIAPVCPYWSPIMPSEYELPIQAKKRKYKGLKGINFTIYNRKEGCTYYNQFNSYLDAEAIIFNSAKYKLEVLMNRKPETEVEIIDECDEFLDSFSNVRRINLNRLFSSLNNIFPEDDSANFILDKISKCTLEILRDSDIRSNKDISELNKTKIYDLLKIFIDNSQILDFIDEDNYCSSVGETALMFSDFLEESYVNFYLDEKGLVVEIVTTNLAKKFNELVNKSKAIIMMSGTIHSEKVLKNVFGIDDFAVIDAEIINQGKIFTKEMGIEFDCKYENFSSGKYSRKDYLVALDNVVENAPRPTLIHVNSFDDLPSIDEKERFFINNIISKEKFINMQNESEERVEKFKKGEIDILFTTKCNRGVDFPDEQCRGIVFTKYPNPNAQSVFWKILKKTHPGYYWEFYKDKAKREFLQKIYRGVRNINDFVYVLSPDLRVIHGVKTILK